MMKVEIKKVKLSTIKLNPDNPRKIAGPDMDRLVKSLTDFPEMMELREIVVDDNMTILGGNMRYQALKKIKAKDCLAKVVKGLTDAQKREFVIKDNSNFGAYDWDVLKSDWDDLPLDDWGVDLPDDWLKEPDAPKDAEPQIDKAAELNKVWKVKAGDLYQIGEHRLLCGDSTLAADVQKVMGGEKAAVISDPPYGVAVVGKNGMIGGPKLAKGGVYTPIVGDETTETAKAFYLLCIELGFVSFGLWGGNYFTDFLPPSSCWFVWDKRGDIASNNFADCELMWTSLDKPSRVYKQVWMGMIKEGEHGKRVHPTQKPVDTAQESIKLFTEDVIYDGFLGSGTTMVACQNLNRKCRGIEISSDYCAVILQRMADAFPDIEIKKIER